MIKLSLSERIDGVEETVKAVELEIVAAITVAQPATEPATAGPTPPAQPTPPTGAAQPTPPTGAAQPAPANDQPAPAGAAQPAPANDQPAPDETTSAAPTKIKDLVDLTKAQGITPEQIMEACNICGFESLPKLAAAQDEEAIKAVALTLGL